MSIYYQDDFVKCGPSEVPKTPGIMRIFDIFRSTRTAPESAGNTRRGLTRSSDITREGLPDMVPSNSPRDPYADIEGESAVERKKRLAREKTRRYRARLAGEDVPTAWTADAEFIAHARTAVPALVAAVERVQALHTPDEFGMCEGCGDNEHGYAIVPHPCPTIRALGDGK